MFTRPKAAEVCIYIYIYIYMYIYIYIYVLSFSFFNSYSRAGPGSLAADALPAAVRDRESIEVPLQYSRIGSIRGG